MKKEKTFDEYLELIKNSFNSNNYSNKAVVDFFMPGSDNKKRLIFESEPGFEQNQSERKGIISLDKINPLTKDQFPTSNLNIFLGDVNKIYSSRDLYTKVKSTISDNRTSIMLIYKALIPGNREGRIDIYKV